MDFNIQHSFCSHLQIRVTVKKKKRKKKLGSRNSLIEYVAQKRLLAKVVQMSSVRLRLLPDGLPASVVHGVNLNLQKRVAWQRCWFPARVAVRFGGNDHHEAKKAAMTRGKNERWAHTLAGSWISMSSSEDVVLVECWGCSWQFTTLMLVFSCICLSKSRTSSKVISERRGWGGAGQKQDTGGGDSTSEWLSRSAGPREVVGGGRCAQSDSWMLAWTREPFESNQRGRKERRRVRKSRGVREESRPGEKEGGGGQGEAGETGSLSLYLRPLKLLALNHAMQPPKQQKNRRSFHVAVTETLAQHIFRV